MNFQCMTAVIVSLEVYWREKKKEKNAALIMNLVCIESNHVKVEAAI